MAGVISTGDFAKDLLPGINEWYGLAYNSQPTLYDKMFEVKSSNRAYEEDVLASGMGMAQLKPEGEAIRYDSAGQGPVSRYTHETMALGFIITNEMMADGQSTVIAELRAKALAKAQLTARETAAANVYNRAFNSSYTGGDGKELLATDHPTRGADLSNELATASDLSEAALEQALIDIDDFKDDRGLRMKAQGKKLILPKELRFDAHRIIKSSLRVATADNDANAINDMNMFPGGMVVNNYLTDADAWFIMTDVDNGLKHYVRQEAVVQTDNDFDTSNARFKTQARYSFGWSDPRGLFGSPGA